MTEYISICYYRIRNKDRTKGIIITTSGEQYAISNIAYINCNKCILHIKDEIQDYYYKVISYQEYQALLALNPFFPNWIKIFISFCKAHPSNNKYIEWIPK